MKLFSLAKKVEEESRKHQILPYILLMIPLSVLICLLLLCVRLSYVLILDNSKENEYDEVQELPNPHLEMPEMQHNSRRPSCETNKENILETSLQLSTVDEGDEDANEEEMNVIVVDKTEPIKESSDDEKGENYFYYQIMIHFSFRM